MNTSRTTPTNRQTSLRGFTLLELMVTLAIAAILATLAAPAMQDMIIKSRLSGVGSQFTGHILRARNEAISHNTCTVMCLSTTTETAITTSSGKITAGPTCANAGNDWQQGWIVFLKEDCINNTQDANSRPELPEDYIVIKSSIGVSYKLLAQSGSPPTRFFFDASGRPGNLNGTAQVNMQYDTSNSTLTQNFGFNICVDSVGRTRTISWSQSC